MHVDYAKKYSLTVQNLFETPPIDGYSRKLD